MMHKSYLFSICVWMIITAAAFAQSPRKDAYGDPLPKYAFARLGSMRFRHHAPIKQIEITPDGKYVFTMTADGAFYIWKGVTRESFSPPKFGSFTVRGFHLFNQGKELACVRGESVCFYDLATWRRKDRRIYARSDVFVIAPNFRHVVWGIGREFQLHHGETGAFRGSLSPFYITCHW